MWDTSSILRDFFWPRPNYRPIRMTTVGATAVLTTSVNSSQSSRYSTKVTVFEKVQETTREGSSGLPDTSVSQSLLVNETGSGSHTESFTLDTTATSTYFHVERRPNEVATSSALTTAVNKGEASTITGYLIIGLLLGIGVLMVVLMSVNVWISIRNKRRSKTKRRQSQFDFAL